MKFLLASVTFGIVISCVKCGYSPSNFYSDTPETVKRFCDLPQKQRENFRFCLLENGVEESILIYRNCAQQVKFFYTLQEIDKFVCHTSSKKEYSQVINCLVRAYQALNKDLPKRVPVITECLSKEEKTEHHFPKYSKEEKTEHHFPKYSKEQKTGHHFPKYN